MSLFDSASLVVTPNGTKASKLYAIKPTDGSGDLTVTRATTATRVNSTGLIESVANNVPRIDYTNGSCPSILVEPQRTNLALYSEQFDNASWEKYNTTVTANNAISPNGTLTADKLVEDSATATHFIYSNEISVTAGNYYSFSFFAKKIDIDYISVTAGNYGQLQINSTFNINNGTVVSSSGTAKITQIGDYYLCQVSGLSTTTRLQGIAIYLNRNNVAPPFSYTGNGTSGVHIWGAQLEAGSYATSYIPTVASSVTRNADVISKTGISSLIGQTEGTMFCEIQNWQTQLDKVILALSDGSLSNYLQISTNSVTGDLQSVIFTGGSVGVLGSITPTIGQNYKIAIGYKLNNYVIYINGIQIGTLNPQPSPSSLTRFDLGSIDFLASNYQPRTPYKVAGIWKTRLTNAELAQLTTI